MSANALQFSLGMEAAGFMKTVEKAGGKLASFLGFAGKITGAAVAFELAEKAGLGFFNIFEGISGAIERGAALEHLSKQTGESVRNLFLLQKGLKAVGLDASEAGTMVYQLQKSLGGVNEAGEPTAYVFGQLGLQIDELKKMDAPSAIEAIAKSMQGMNANSATAAAGHIFGRGGAREFLQLSRSSKEFTQALKENAGAAAQAQRTAAGFAKIELALDKLKGKGNALFAGIAEGLAPTINMVVGMLNKIDLSGVGQAIGETVSGLIEITKAGYLGSLMMEGFKAALDTLPTLALASLAKLGVLILRTFEKPVQFFQTIFESVIQHIMEWLCKIPGLNDVLGLKEFKAERIEDIFAARQQSGAEYFTQGNNVDTMNRSADDLYKESLAQAKSKFGELGSFVRGVGREANKGYQDSTNAGEKGGEGKQPLAPYKPAFTALEKLGFSRGGGITTDHQRETARNTKQLIVETVKTQQAILHFLGMMGSTGGAANPHP